MAYRLLATSYRIYEGLSTDVKPTLATDQTGQLLEINTGDRYTWDGSAWVIIGKANVDGKQRISNTPYGYDVAEGNIANHAGDLKLGYNSDVGATEEDIWTIGGVYAFPSTGMGMRVISSSANDTALGTGVQTVRISYLLHDYTASSETITLAGTTSVLMTSADIFRVNSIRAMTAGTNNVAAGDINVTNTTGAVVYRSITTGYTRGRGAIYTVPLGKTLYITDIHVASGFTTAGKVVRWTWRYNYDDASDTILPVGLMMAYFGAITQDAVDSRTIQIPIKVPATCDYKMSAISNGAGSFAQCSLRGWLE